MSRFYQLLFVRLCEGVYKEYFFCLTHGQIYHLTGTTQDKHTGAACNSFALWPYDTPEKAYYLCKILEEGEQPK